MASAKRDIRTLIESLSEDLLLIARDVVEAHVARAVSEWQAKNEKIQLRKSAEDERTLRNRQALERIERVAARRREREEKKAAANALRMEQRALSETSSGVSSSGVSSRKPRARRGLLAEGTEAAVKKEPTPPPLFVHKRRRDGEIEQMKRDDTGVVSAAAAAPPAVEAAI